MERGVVVTGRITLMDGAGQTWFQPVAEIDGWLTKSRVGFTIPWTRAQVERLFPTVVEVVEPEAVES